MKNQEKIRAWVIKAKKMGYSQAQIEEELKKHGYTANSFNRPFRINADKSNRNIIIAVSITLFLLILGVSSYIFFSRLNNIPEEEASLEKAIDLLNKNNSDNALELFRVLTESSDAKEAFVSNYYAGTIYFDKQEYDKALPYLKRAAELNPDKACDTNNKIGRIYLLQGDVDTALQYFFLALEVDKKSGNKFKRSIIADINYRIGQCYTQKKEYDLAIKYFKEAYDLRPDRQRFIYKLGEIYYLNKEYDKAESYLTRYIKLNPPSDSFVKKAEDYLADIQETKNLNDSMLRV